MSFISDYKSSPINLFNRAGSTLGGVTTTDATLSTELGFPFRAADGREFLLVQVGATNIGAGVLVQSPASIGANHSNLVCSTQAIGDATITVTLGGTGVSANQYMGGFLTLTGGTGAGQTLEISSHPAQSNGTGTVVLTLRDPLSVATAAASTTGTLTFPNFGSSNGTAAAANVQSAGVIINPTTPTGRVIGATIYPLTASTTTIPTYGWIQKSGAIGLLNQGGTTIGLDIMPSGTVAGAVATYAVASGTRVGVSTVAGVDTKYGMVTLQL